jgi:hypothetical protein
LPVDGLLMKRTGSKNSRVGPAVMRQRRDKGKKRLGDGG